MALHKTRKGERRKMPKEFKTLNIFHQSDRIIFFLVQLLPLSLSLLSLGKGFDFLRVVIRRYPYVNLLSTVYHFFCLCGRLDWREPIRKIVKVNGQTHIHNIHYRQIVHIVKEMEISTLSLLNLPSHLSCTLLLSDGMKHTRLSFLPTIKLPLG